LLKKITFLGVIFFLFGSKKSFLFKQKRGYSIMSLIRRVKDNNLNDVNRLIREGVDVNAVDQEGRTALWYAAARGHVRCATALLDAKADMDKADNYGYTPLWCASYNGRAECVRVTRLCGSMGGGGG